jgi:hypothetical protein
MGNFVSGISVCRQYDFTMDFWANARKTGDLLNRKLGKASTRMIALSLVDALDDSLIDAASFAGFGGYENRAAKKLCDIVCGIPAGRGLGISNLGKFTLGFQHFSLDEMWFVPPLFALHDFITGVFTVNGEMRFCLRYAAADMDEEEAEKLFAAARGMLLSK